MLRFVVDDKEVSKMSIFWVWVIVGLIAGYLAKRVLHEGPQGIYGDPHVAHASPNSRRQVRR